MASPPSQKYAQIALHLTGGGLPDASFVLPIRPEDLVYPRPMRQAVTQTLGSAFLDDWGEGIGNISITGNTGWRGGLFFSGQDAFFALKDVIFDQWVSRRQASIQRGQDPSLVTLVYSDSLNQVTKVVSPKNFTLRRSRSRPLLFGYSAQLVVLADVATAQSIVDEIAAALSNPLKWLAGITGLGTVLTAIQYWVTTGVAAIGELGAAVGSFMTTGASLLQSISGIASNLGGTFDAVTGASLSAATSYALAGANGLSALAADPTLSQPAQLALSSAASDWNEAFCLLSNSFSTAQTYPTFYGLYGASTCSSTSGGDPPSNYVLTDTNPWQDIAPVPPAAITLSASAAQACAALSDPDPLTLVGQDAMITANLQTASAGVSLPA